MSSNLFTIGTRDVVLLALHISSQSFIPPSHKNDVDPLAFNILNSMIREIKNSVLNNGFV